MSIKEKLRHAFAVESPEDAISAEDRRILEKVAREVVRRRLTTPALMFLESVRPLNFFGSQAMVFLQPIAAFVVSPQEVERFALILEKRKSIDTLMEIIEKDDHERT
ncbi:MAG: hypothetical protein A2Z34_08305 [Planctomycetes bacterium RBG_16_59_8]|nr:MAG: hypothetical protein A2Z34_08305 [Planctomycetes bacterium RBG_16_59_8]